jgi:hypothetical protein
MIVGIPRHSWHTIGPKQMEESYIQQHGMEGITAAECNLLMMTIYAFYSRSRKPTISSVTFVRPFVPVEQWGSVWAGFD